MKLFNSETISIDALKKVFQDHIPVRIIDIRSQESYDQWHIPGSKFLPVNEVLQESDENIFAYIDFKSNFPVIVVCQEGFISQKATEQLRNLGVEAYSLEGGIKQWSRVWNTAEIQFDDTRIIQVRRVGKGCLSYMIINDGEAAVIDAAVEPQVFIDFASAYQSQIKYVIDTHIHADHFSRSKLLAQQTGAVLLMPFQNILQYDFKPVYDGARFRIGNATLEALHTPGHTQESFSYRLNQNVLFSGDLLFLNGVGRPDLKSNEQIARQKTKKLYQSIQKILEFPDDTLVLPGHFHRPVPFDGTVIASFLKSLKTDLNLLNMDETAFVEEILTDMPKTPPNFEQIVALNISGDAGSYNLLDLEAGENRCSSQK